MILSKSISVTALLKTSPPISPRSLASSLSPATRSLRELPAAALPPSDQANSGPRRLAQTMATPRRRHAARSAAHRATSSTRGALHGMPRFAPRAAMRSRAATTTAARAACEPAARCTTPRTAAPPRAAGPRRGLSSPARASLRSRPTCETNAARLPQYRASRASLARPRTPPGRFCRRALHTPAAPRPATCRAIAVLPTSR